MQLSQEFTLIVRSSFGRKLHDSEVHRSFPSPHSLERQHGNHIIKTCRIEYKTLLYSSVVLSVIRSCQTTQDQFNALIVDNPIDRPRICTLTQ
jgi:hypothetical protein